MLGRRKPHDLKLTLATVMNEIVADIGWRRSARRTRAFSSTNPRGRAAKLAELPTVPCIVRELTDDEAIIIMVDSHVQREKMLPSSAFCLGYFVNKCKKPDTANPSLCPVLLRNVLLCGSNQV